MGIGIGLGLGVGIGSGSFGGGGSPPTPAIDITSHSSGFVFQAGKSYTVSGTCAACTSVALTFNANALGTDPGAGAGVWAVTFTPAHAIAALAGTLLATGDTSGADVTDSITADVFSPSIEASTVLWTDITDPAQYTLSGANFLTLKDRISATNLTANATPVFASTAIAGTPGIEYNSSTDCFTTTNATIVAAGQNFADLTVAFAGVLPAANTFACGVSWARSDAAATQDALFFGRVTGGSGLWGMLARTSAAVSNTRTSVTADSNPHVHVWVITAGVVVHWLDGVAQAMSSAVPISGTSAPNRLGIGSLVGSTIGNHWAGHGGGAIVCSVAKNAAGVASLSRFLGAQHGITVP